MEGQNYLIVNPFEYGITIDDFNLILLLKHKEVVDDGTE